MPFASRLLALRPLPSLLWPRTLLALLLALPAARLRRVAADVRLALPLRQLLLLRRRASIAGAERPLGPNLHKVDMSE